MATLALVAGAAGCASDSLPDAGGARGPADAGVVPSADATPAPAPDAGLTLEAFGAQYQEALCRLQARCFDDPGFVPGCLARGAGGWDLELRRTWAPMLAAGAARFDPDAAAECLRSLDARADCYAAVLPDPCEALFVGQRAPGAACGDSRECAPDAYCRGASGTTCGACTPRLLQGERCEAAADGCERGRRCAQSGSYLICQPIRGAGEGCGQVDGVCDGWLRCDGVSQRCERPRGLGEPCSPFRFPPECDVFAGVACDGARCAEVQPARLGEDCSSLAAVCLQGYCGSGGLCTPYREEGAPCEPAQCGLELFCSAAGRCERSRGEGEPCGDELLCDLSLQCAGDPEARTCVLGQWAPCGG